ncbi:hypothetical protein KIW84_044651, partial [Lathyrus oleraceus]
IHIHTITKFLLLHILMKFKILYVVALLFLTLIGINGSKSDEEYWNSIWPNTPIPKTLSDMLLSDIGTNMPIKNQEEKQYWTIFFEHDLYPGKTINLGIQKDSDIQSSKSITRVPVKKKNHTFKTRKWLGQTPGKENQSFESTIRSDKETKIEIDRANKPFGKSVWGYEKKIDRSNQPFEFSAWDEEEIEKENQPFGLFVWYKKEIEKEKQPLEFSVWDKKETEKEEQPFEFSVWDKKEIEKANQPFEFWAWSKKETEKTNQPFGFWGWSRKETKKPNQPFVQDTQKPSQHFIENSLDEKETHILNNYCGTSSAIGEDKYCASSLKLMIDFAISKLGKNIKVMSSFFSQNQDKYVVEEVKKIGDRTVMCHRLNFKKVVFYCHTVNATTTYMVPLVASDGTKSKALTICHHDTRGMNPKVLYEVLNIKPGTVPVCHFIGNKAIAWVPDMNESGGHPWVI